jgi:hypothetical protein
MKLREDVAILTMIRFSQLCALAQKSRGGKDSRAAIYFGTFAVDQLCNRRANNHRQYATIPRGINAVCIFVAFDFRCNYFLRVPDV